MEFVLRGQLLMSLKLIIMESYKKVIELQYHNELNKVFLFKCYWYDITDREIKVDPHYGLVEINTKVRLHNIDNIFIFVKQCTQVYYIYTLLFRKNRSMVD